MAVLKNDDNTQFGRVNNADGTSPIGTATVNDGLAPLLDQHGRLVVTQFIGGGVLSTPVTPVDSAGVVLWQLISAASGKLFQAWGSQNSGAALWVQLFNVAAGPPAGAPYVAPVPCVSGGMWSMNFPEGLAFGTGLVIAYSTAHAAYAAPAVGGWITGHIR